MTSRILVVADPPANSHAAIVKGAARATIELRGGGPVNRHFLNARIP